jgi:hypothetical protein
MNIVELTGQEVDIIRALIDVVSDLPCGYDAIEGYKGVNMETIYDDISQLKLKLK